MALWISRDGTRTLEAPASQYWSLVGGGWRLIDPSSVPVVPTPGRTIGSLTLSGSVLTAVYSDGTVQTLTLPSAGGGSTTSNVAIDTDGRAYYQAGGTAQLAVDTDGRTYLIGA